MELARLAIVARQWFPKKCSVIKNGTAHGSNENRRHVAGKIRERALAIARGEYKPTSEEPLVWFSSMRLAAEILSNDNRALLHVIMERKPPSICALARMTGRSPKQLSRVLRKLANYGIVELKSNGAHAQPVAKTAVFKLLVT